MNSGVNLPEIKYSRKRVRSGLLEYVFYWSLMRRFKYDYATIEYINKLIQLDASSEKPQQMQLINKLLEF